MGMLDFRSSSSVNVCKRKIILQVADNADNVSQTARRTLTLQVQISRFLDKINIMGNKKVKKLSILSFL